MSSMAIRLLFAAVLVGWCCNRLLTASESTVSSASSTLSSSSSVSKSDDNTAAPVPRQSVVAAAEQRIEMALDQRLVRPLEYEREYLTVVMEDLAEQYDIPVVFDKSALAEVAIKPESEVTISVRDITLRSALNLMFRQPRVEDLTYSVHDEVLLITTEDYRDERLVTRVYRVDDLLKLQPPQAQELELYPNLLIDVIVQCIEHDSWMENGTGDGEIQYLPPGMLVVSQPRHIQREIEMLLQHIRRTTQLIEKERRP